MKSNFNYTIERNVQIVIALLKAHGIHRIIASPGTTNMTFVVSVQNDSWFNLWSSVDERSAAYLACGMAAETGEPVVLSCTGATASRNYMPGLTEAFYRKLPVLAITSTRGNHKIGHLIDQQIDRRNIPNDIAVESVTVPTIKDVDDERFCEIETNKAILALKLNGGGPAHINMYTQYSNDFSIKELPPVNAIFRHTITDLEWPTIPKGGRIIIRVGSHANFSEALTKAVDTFCASYDAVVCCDHTSGYRGRYEVHTQLLCGQKQFHSPLTQANLCIHIGEVSGDQFCVDAKHTWRVSPDGALRDTFGTLRRVFMMPEDVFFNHYAMAGYSHSEYYDRLVQEIGNVKNRIPELPFSNIWIAQQMVDLLPSNSELHLGIYHSLRSWNFFKLPAGIQAKCNVGGFGIDGGISTMIGASLVNPDKLFIGVFGDLAFFYDMNVLGNRHVGKNVRILIINNGKGNEFRNYNHPCYFLGDEADEFIAASGHYGNKSHTLVKDYATDLGYEYSSASSKDEFQAKIRAFLDPQNSDKPKLFETFTQTDDESISLELILNTIVDPKIKIKSVVKKIVKKAVGDRTIQELRQVVKK